MIPHFIHILLFSAERIFIFDWQNIFEFRFYWVLRKVEALFFKDQNISYTSNMQQP